VAKGKSRKEYILDTDPKQLIKDVRSYQIRKSGVTAETAANIKKEDRAQVEKAEAVEE